jgi:hypothetical protein
VSECNTGAPLVLLRFWKSRSAKELRERNETACTVLEGYAPLGIGARPDRSGALITSRYQMAETKRKRAAEEPLGIVISRGSREETPPAFSVYVWGPAPEPEPSSDSKAA